MGFKTFLKESPFIQGIKDKNSHSMEMDFKYYLNSDILKLISDDFTAMNYKIYKTPSYYFVTESNKYLLSIQYTDISLIYNNKKHKSIQIETAHSKEKGLYPKFLEFLMSKKGGYKFIVSDSKQSVQANKSWKKLINRSENIYKILGNDIVKIDKTEVKELDNTPWKLGISENSVNNHTNRLLEYYDALTKYTYRRDIKNNPKDGDDILFISSYDED